MYNNEPKDNVESQQIYTRQIKLLESVKQINYQIEAGVWFSRYVITVMLVDGKQKIAYQPALFEPSEIACKPIQKITEMVFPKVYFFSALLGGVVGGILTMLTLKILEARPREQTRVEVDNVRETGEGQIGIGVQESTKLEQEHDERCC